MKALLDTNFLLIPGQFRVDILSELSGMGYESVTIDLVMKELLEISGKGGRDASAARIALDLVRESDVEVIGTRGSFADSEIFRMATENGFAACTQDRELSDRIRAAGGKVIRLRQKRYLEEG